MGSQEIPAPPAAKSLAASMTFTGYGVGDYRVVYQISDEVLVVLVVTIGLKLLTGRS